jgi:hypothetical protein
MFEVANTYCGKNQNVFRLFVMKDDCCVYYRDTAHRRAEVYYPCFYSIHTVFC